MYLQPTTTYGSLIPGSDYFRNLVRQGTIVEKVSFLDAGSEERIIAYLFLPAKARPPYQSVVYFPGSSAMSLDSVFDYTTIKNHLKIAYQGLNWGAYAGPIHLALEKRYKAAILAGGGFYWEMYAPERGSPEWDAVNFAPRVDLPLLMQNGRYDTFYPLETNVRRLFRLFGTPEKDKHLVVYPTGHSVWLLNEYRKDVFDFLDRYLGRPNG